MLGLIIITVLTMHAMCMSVLFKLQVQLYYKYKIQNYVEVTNFGLLYDSLNEGMFLFIIVVVELNHIII